MAEPFVDLDVDDAEVIDMLARARLRQDPLLREELVVIGGIVQGHLKASAPKGRNHRGRGASLADSFKIRSRPSSVVVSSYKPYAAIMEAGGETPPHDIKPKKAMALAFNGVFAKIVHHPGAAYAGKHFAAKVAREDGALIAERLARAVDRSFR